MGKSREKRRRKERKVIRRKDRQAMRERLDQARRAGVVPDLVLQRLQDPADVED